MKQPEVGPVDPIAGATEPRQSGTSHLIFKTPWPGDPRVNIQGAKGKAKPYQVRQVPLAIDKLERQP